MSTQLQRIDSHIMGEIPPPVRVLLRCSVPGAPEVTLERTLEVMRSIARAQAAAAWPGDDEWRRVLPVWFLSSFPRDVEELLENPLLWDFGSWLDAMRRPGWEWWSSEMRSRALLIRCSAHTFPYSIGPLEYLLRAAGVADLSVEEED